MLRKCLFAASLVLAIGGAALTLTSPSADAARPLDAGKPDYTLGIAENVTLGTIENVTLGDE